jgi:hypothetical protein
VKRAVPAALAALAGIVVLAGFFSDNAYLGAASATLTDWVTILAALALVLGLWNLLQTHARKAARRESGWGSSLVLLGGMLAVLLLGLRPGSQGPSDAAVSWVFSYVYVPLNATIFSLLAFFVATAAYRTLRVRSWESAALLIVGTVVLLGQVPLGFQLWPQLPLLKAWLLQVLGAGGLRGIALGVALGTVATGLRLLLGQDRPYLGGDKPK